MVAQPSDPQLIRCSLPWASTLVVAKLGNGRLMLTTHIKRLTHTFPLPCSGQKVTRSPPSKMLWEADTDLSRRVALCAPTLLLLGFPSAYIGFPKHGPLEVRRYQQRGQGLSCINPLVTAASREDRPPGRNQWAAEQSVDRQFSQNGRWHSTKL